LARLRATELIRQTYAVGPQILPADLAKTFRKKMVELYWLLTGEMPQVPGIELDFPYSFEPALEWTPHEADPNQIMSVIPGLGEGPDILIKGDQDAEEEEKDRRRELGGRSRKLLPHSSSK
jgi:hypothetical protein